MFSRFDTQHPESNELIAAGIAISAIILLLSFNTAERPDTADLPQAQSFSEDRRDSSGSIPYPQPVPPSLQKGVFR